MIRPVTYRELIADPGCAALFAEYAEECGSPELGPYKPQADLYDRLEKSGGMQCFAMYADSLVGFANVLIYTVPHSGAKVGNTESIFITHKRRAALSGFELMDSVKAYATAQGCQAFIWSAPVNSRFARLLHLRKAPRHSNQMFVEAL